MSADIAARTSTHPDRPGREHHHVLAPAAARGGPRDARPALRRAARDRDRPRPVRPRGAEPEPDRRSAQRGPEPGPVRGDARGDAEGVERRVLLPPRPLLRVPAAGRALEPPAQPARRAVRGRARHDHEDVRHATAPAAAASAAVAGDRYPAVDRVGGAARHPGHVLAAAAVRAQTPLRALPRARRRGRLRPGAGRAARRSCATCTWRRRWSRRGGSSRPP